MDETSQWKKVKSSIESDRRYELIGSSSKREQFFYEYIQEVEVCNLNDISLIWRGGKTWYLPRTLFLAELATRKEYKVNDGE